MNRLAYKDLIMPLENNRFNTRRRREGSGTRGGLRVWGLGWVGSHGNMGSNRGEPRRVVCRTGSLGGFFEATRRSGEELG